MSEQGAVGQWKPEEIKLLGKAPDLTVAQQLGRSEAEVRAKRWGLKIRKWQRYKRVGEEPDLAEQMELHFGPYEVPEVGPGEWLECQLRGSVEVGDFSDAPIPWPRKAGTRSLILCGDLIAAVQKESELAVAYHWRVCIGVVTKWRRALGVEPVTEGTHELKVFLSTNNMNATPVLREHLSEAKTGRPIQYTPEGKARVMEAIQQPKSAQWFASMAEHFQARRGKAVDPETRVWTAEEESLLGTKADEEVAQMVGRSVAAVAARRVRNGIPVPNPVQRRWTEAEVQLLREWSAEEVAKRTGRPLESVMNKRRELGMIIRPPRRPWTPEEEQLLGTKPDTQLAQVLGRDRTDVQRRRVALGIAPAKNHALYEYWTAEEDKLLGTAPDAQVAPLVGRSTECVRRRRLALGLASYRARREAKLLEAGPAKEL